MTSITLDFDDDDKVRIQGLAAAEAAAFQPLKSVVATGLSTDSSIGKADGVASPPRHRPQLQAPRYHYMLDLLDLHQGVEGVVSKELIVFKTQSKNDLAQIEKLEAKKNEELRRHAEDTASRNHWTVLGNVAQYLAAGTSIAVGISLGATAWGPLLVASGVVGLGNRVVRDTVGWQSVTAWFSKSVETQKKLVQQIEMGFLYIELGTGLFGGIGASAAGAFSAMAADTSRLIAAKKLSATIQATGVGMKMTAQLGRSFSDKRISDLQVRMRILDTEAEKIRMEMTSQATDARNMIDTALSVGQELHKAIAASEIHDL